MNPAPELANPTRAVRLLHGALVGGLAMSGAVFVLVRRLSLGPTFPLPPILAFVLAGFTIIVVLLAARIVRPTIPDRQVDQSSDAYWSDAIRRGRALILWAMTEGSGLVAVIGYYLTGVPATAIAYAVALGTLIMFRPSRLEATGAA